ncbi:MAG: serine/threonine protein kinase [Sandaracinaceae bacterium]|nr:serine/threonine protein kinase [Sandaracinaceae bacterium]
MLGFGYRVQAVVEFPLADRFVPESAPTRGRTSIRWRVVEIATGKKGVFKLFVGPEDRPPQSKAICHSIEKLARLNHPSIAPPLAWGVVGECPWLFREWIHGISLRLLINQRATLPTERVSRVGLQIARALEVLHRMGILQGELSPEHVIIAKHERIVLIDCGILPAVPTTQSALMRSHYLAPEFVSGQQPGTKSDLYALGMILLEMLNPHGPQGELPDGIPTELRALIAKLTAKNPAQRASLNQVLQTLEGLIASPPSPVEAPPLPSSSNPQTTERLEAIEIEEVDEVLPPSPDRTEPLPAISLETDISELSTPPQALPLEAQAQPPHEKVNNRPLQTNRFFSSIPHFVGAAAVGIGCFLLGYGIARLGTSHEQLDQQAAEEAPDQVEIVVETSKTPMWIDGEEKKGQAKIRSSPGALHRVAFGEKEWLEIEWRGKGLLQLRHHTEENHHLAAQLPPLPTEPPQDEASLQSDSVTRTSLNPQEEGVSTSPEALPLEASHPPHQSTQKKPKATSPPQPSSKSKPSFATRIGPAPGSSSPQGGLRFATTLRAPSPEP